MKEIFRVCTINEDHIFATDDGEGYWMNVEKCPYCKCPLKTIEINTKSIRSSTQGGNKCSEANGFFRGKYIDSLPVLPWFYEIKPLNDENQYRSGDSWGKTEAISLGDFYKKYGDADAITWKSISEKEFKRSLAAIERQLRAVKACLNGDKNFDDLFPDI